LPPKPIFLPSKEEREKQEQNVARYHFKKIREMLP
jgi:hypothetical protein